MNPEQRIDFDVKQARHLRLIISLGLVLLLCAIITTYIYFGMQFARNTVPIETPQEFVEVTAPDITVIEAALENTAIVSPEEMAVIEAALVDTAVVPNTDLESIQAALGQPVN